MVVSIRYSAARRQFGAPSSKIEVSVLHLFGILCNSVFQSPVLDYPLQQMRLFPLLAGTYCFKFFADYLSLHFEDCETRSQQNDGSKVSA